MLNEQVKNNAASNKVNWPQMFFVDTAVNIFVHIFKLYIQFTLDTLLHLAVIWILFQATWLLSQVLWFSLMD
jgi:hypothetical protein